MGRENRFHNVFRWSKVGDLLCLEHLRYGPDRPVHLFDLRQVSPEVWESATPHVCSEDCYAAVMREQDDCIVLRWSVNGPKKSEEIEYEYS